MRTATAVAIGFTSAILGTVLGFAEGQMARTLLVIAVGITGFCLGFLYASWSNHPQRQQKKGRR